jgi:hypothetical protein
MILQIISYIVVYIIPILGSKHPLSFFIQVSQYLFEENIRRVGKYQMGNQNP